MDKSPQSLTEAFIEQFNELGMSNALFVCPAKAVPEIMLEQYWLDVLNADLLKYRISDVVDPGMKDILAMLQDTNKLMFNVIDCFNGKVVADFQLDNFTGKSAQVHFSLHPENNIRFNIFIADSVSDMILENWSDTLNMEESYINTLVGITPTENRPACKFIQKAGLKAQCIIPDAANYLGGISDILITTKTRN